MDYKPQDIFLGVIDLFAILLPGMVLAFFMAAPGLQFLEQQGMTLGAPGRWLAYFAGAYTLGHFLSLGGGYVLDSIYDRLWERRKQRDRRKSALAERASTLLVDLLPNAFDPKTDSFVKWAVALIAASKPELIASLDRKEADQKLFRSLTIVFVLIPAFLVSRGLPIWSSILSVGLAVLSFSRYCDQRGKYAQLAYLYLFAIHETGQLKASAGRTAKTGHSRND